LIGIASVVLLAWIIAANPVNTENRQAVDIGVAGRTNAYASIAAVADELRLPFDVAPRLPVDASSGTPASGRSDLHPQSAPGGVMS
jgi:hypothetical protein